MAAISTWHYLLDQARRRFTPTLNNIPGMGLIEKRVVAHEWKTKVLAEPPAGSGLKPVLGDSGLPLLGHTIEFFREGPDFALHMYRTHDPLFFPTRRSCARLSSRGPRPSRPSSPTRTRTSPRRAGTRSSARSSTGA
jgi:hypothetical protein